MTDDDNETWLLDTGDAVIAKKAAHGVPSLTPLERLIYCLWVADYGMRNAGDLTTACDVFPAFQEEGRQASEELGLAEAAAAFSMPAAELEQRYFTIFDTICREIRAMPSGQGMSA